MSKTKTKYVNHDGWPELRKRLEREIELFESFVTEPTLTLETALEYMEFGTKFVSPSMFQEIYDVLFRTYPIIKTRVSKAVFPSWMITHSVDELKQAIGYKNE